jgi:hypothetical protein
MDTTTTTTTTTTTYYRTGAGSHRHARRSCAFVHKRSLFVGEVSEVPAADVEAYEPCTYCCPDAEVAAHAAKPAPAAMVADDGKCTNKFPVPGSYNMSRVYVTVTCADCGATEVSMVRSSGNLRKHTRAN